MEIIKNILKSRGVEVHYPKDVLKETYQGRLINDESVWLSMLKDRNLTSYTYNQELADQIYNNIKDYIPILKITFVNLSKKRS